MWYICTVRDIKCQSCILLQFNVTKYGKTGIEYICSWTTKLFALRHQTLHPSAQAVFKMDKPWPLLGAHVLEISSVNVPAMVL